ncbi:MAG: UDP-glucose 4-epimerase GalE [Rhodospirillaceae bacterium]|nr:UDP-glucose 4-epimerase GalE [Rhodospirillaceae bacterium]|tara:strand:- start:8703 stop:9476 length:774 start_codon:yes stop_codon:yes gene_type:complete
MHLAAVLSVEESTQDPFHYYDVNTAGTLNLAESCIKNGVQKLIFSSSSTVYGDPKEGPFLLNSRTEPINPYGRSKLMGECILADCAKASGLDVTALRYFNAAGADPDGEIELRSSNASQLIPKLMSAIANDTPFSIYGTDYDTEDGTCIRDYIHVWDVANAHIAALKSPFQPGTNRFFNIGIGKGRSVREVVNSVQRITGITLRIVERERRRGDASVVIAGDIEEIQSQLGWVAKYREIDDIVSHSWRWHCQKTKSE